jgi:hypothetical protein
MKNAHLRIGTLEFRKVTRDTTLSVRVWLDRLILECESEGNRHGKAHLVSVFGGEQDVAAVAAAIAEQTSFTVRGPGLTALQIVLGEDPEIIRSSLNIPGRKRAVRHLVAISKELALTRPGGDLKARRTVLVSADAAFVLHRIGVRFGLPVLPQWSEWFSRELKKHHAVRRLIGLGCDPILVSGTKKRFLGWFGHAIKRGQISIPDGDEVAHWKVPAHFSAAAEEEPMGKRYENSAIAPRTE